MTGWVYPSSGDAKACCRREATLVSRGWIHNAVKAVMVVCMRQGCHSHGHGVRVDALVMV
jgi:hypothetical protein